MDPTRANFQMKNSYTDRANLFVVQEEAPYAFFDGSSIDHAKRMLEGRGIDWNVKGASIKKAFVDSCFVFSNNSLPRLMRTDDDKLEASDK